MREHSPQPECFIDLEVPPAFFVQSEVKYDPNVVYTKGVARKAAEFCIRGSNDWPPRDIDTTRKVNPDSEHSVEAYFDRTDLTMNQVLMQNGRIIATEQALEHIEQCVLQPVDEAHCSARTALKMLLFAVEYTVADREYTIACDIRGIFRKKMHEITLEMLQDFREKAAVRGEEVVAMQHEAWRELGLV